MALRIICIDDEQIDDEGEFLQEDITEQFNEFAEEYNGMQEYLEQVAASFEEAQGIELSQPAQQLLLARGTSAGASSAGAFKGATKAKASAAASSAGTSGVGGGFGRKGGKFIKTAKAAKPKAASIGKHIVHAAKVVGRAAAKNKGALVAGAAAAGGAGLGYARGRMDAVKASEDDLELGLFGATKEKVGGTGTMIGRSLMSGPAGVHLQNVHNKGLLHGMKKNSKGIKKVGHYAAAGLGGGGLTGGLGAMKALHDVRKNNAAGMYKNRIAASQENLVLDEEEYEVEEEEFEVDDDYTQEELDAMTPEEAADLLESSEFTEDEIAELEEVAAEEERLTGLRDFARNVMVKDAEARIPAKK